MTGKKRRHSGLIDFFEGEIETFSVDEEVRVRKGKRQKMSFHPISLFFPIILHNSTQCIDEVTCSDLYHLRPFQVHLTNSFLPQTSFPTNSREKRKTYQDFQFH